MREKGPFDEAMEELSDLLGQVDSKRDQLKPGALPEGLKDHMNELRHFVEQFQDLTEDALKQAGADPGDLLLRSSWKKDLPKKERQMMESLEGLRRELITRQHDLKAKIEEEQAQTPSESERSGSVKPIKKLKKKRRRKKKFRGLGGDEWLKM